MKRLEFCKQGTNSCYSNWYVFLFFKRNANALLDRSRELKRVESPFIPKTGDSGNENAQTEQDSTKDDFVNDDDGKPFLFILYIYIYE